ncbi:MAG TPA: glycerophosphodiester phosphodiesterase family protein, partial [Clostridia bacterium]|nr:glycerophosphodiester phosphodiesterase family protein [Clostridia bacterium]
MKNFTVTAHTGAMNTKHNSLQSIDAAIFYKADIAEIDVAFRKDGTPVIIHSSEPKDDEGILLADALKCVAKSDVLRLNLDLKAFWNTGAIEELLIKHNLQKRAFFTGVFPENVAEVKNNSPLVPYYINASI